MQHIWTNCEHRGRGQLCGDSERQSVEIKGIFLRFWCVQRQTRNYDAYLKLLPNKASLNWHWNVTPLDIKAPISLVFSCSGYWGTNQNPFSWQSEKWRLQPAFKNLKKCHKKRQRKERLGWERKVCCWFVSVLQQFWQNWGAFSHLERNKTAQKAFHAAKCAFTPLLIVFGNPWCHRVVTQRCLAVGKKSPIGPHGM